MHVDKWDYHRLFICAHAVGLNIDNCHNISRVFAQIVRVCYPIGRCLQIGVNSRFKKRFFVWITRAAVRMYILGRGGGKTPSPRPYTHPKPPQPERDGGGGGGGADTERQTDRQRQRQRD